jgi:hypothetical protein
MENGRMQSTRASAGVEEKWRRKAGPKPTARPLNGSTDLAPRGAVSRSLSIAGCHLYNPTCSCICM